MADVNSIISRLAPWPKEDYSEFGPVERQPLGRITELTGSFLGRNWVSIPHVTHFDDIDTTELESFRAKLKVEDGLKISALPFIIKAVVETLCELPKFSASIDLEAKELVLKKYFNIGVATDTPRGLLVPVVRQCEAKGVAEIAEEIVDLASRARDSGLPHADMTGGCFTVSSLGALGGVGFTPIINAPEVAILAVSRTRVQACPGDDGGVVWRKMLPLSLSYDHRVINGADAGRFMLSMASRLAKPEALFTSPFDSGGKNVGG